MNRIARITLEFLGPPVVATTLYFAIAALCYHDAHLLLPSTIFPALLWAYLFAALPSLIYTGVMELAYSRGLVVGGRNAVLLAGALGLLCGVAIAAAITRGQPPFRFFFSVYPALGLVTGAAIALMAGVMAPQGPKQAPTGTG